MARPSAARSLAQLDDRGGGAPQRFEVHDLRSHVRVEADDLDAGAIPHPPAQVTGLGNRDAELVRLQSRRDVRVAAGVDVGIDTDRHARPRLSFARDRVDALELALRFRVDRLDAEVDGLRQLRPGLPDAGEDNLGRDEPGAQRDVDLAAGVRVDLAAQASQEPHDGQRRIRLERVVHRMGIRGERLVRGAIPGGDGRRAVDVERRAVDGRDVRERCAVADEGSLLAREAHG